MLMFGIFFGTSSLIFSLKIGQATEGNWLQGFYGAVGGSLSANALTSLLDYFSDICLSFYKMLIDN
jgi:branched-subunit amino acid permease